jgi:hypothetical protein
VFAPVFAARCTSTHSKAGEYKIRPYTENIESAVYGLFAGSKDLT